MGNVKLLNPYYGEASSAVAVSNGIHFWDAPEVPNAMCYGLNCTGAVIACAIFLRQGNPTWYGMWCGNHIRDTFYFTHGANYVLNASDIRKTVNRNGVDYYFRGSPYHLETYAITLNGDFTNDDVYANEAEAVEAILAAIAIGATKYPITYSYTNSTVSGPPEATVGDTVSVSAVPDVGYGITDASTQILVTNNDVAVPYTWDAANNRITFTMPDPL